MTIDPASKLTVTRIAVTLSTTTLLSLFAKAGHRLSFFLALVGLAVMISAVLAIRARQKVNADTLNYWDEALLYFATTFLVLPFV